MSNNQLKNIDQEFSNLKSLKKLNLNGNSLTSPCSYFKIIPWIEEISLEGNPMNKDEQTKAIYFIPSLLKLNGINCKDARTALEENKKRLQRKISSFFKESGRVNETNIQSLKKECKKKLKSQISSKEKYFSLLLTQLDDLIDITAEEHFIKMQEQTSDIEEGDDYCKVRYKAELFIRCHCTDDDKNDSKTEISSVSFIPWDSSYASSVVVTCGGNNVCLIDPITNEVMYHYNYPDEEEALTCSASMINEEEEIILAVATSSGNIILFNMVNMSCFFRWNAHADSISSLTFYSSKLKTPKINYLFSASHDNFIKIWNMAEDELSKSSLKPFLQVDMNQQIYTFAYSPSSDVILAGGEKGLIVVANIFHSSPINTFTIPKRTTRKRNSTLTTPQTKSSRRLNGSHNDSSISNSEAYENLVENSIQMVKGFVRIPFVDSMCILDSHPGYLAVKIADKSNISIFSIAGLRKNLEAAYKASSMASKKANLFTQFTCDACFKLTFTPTIHNTTKMVVESNFLAVGDNKGQIWIYDVEDCLTKRESAPCQTLPWPSPDLEDKKSLKATVKCIAFSLDLKTLVSGSSVNLICLWRST